MRGLEDIENIPFITTDQMREVDRAMIEDYGISLVQMMENAGRNLAQLARSRFLRGDPTGRRILVLAGKGGNGCLAFAHEAFKPKGGPCGGDGGKGGDVILQADHDINNLIAQFYAPHLHAKDGRSGEGKGKTGRGGKKLIIKVPCGTMVWKLPPPKPIAREQDVPVRRSVAQAEAIEINLEDEPEKLPKAELGEAEVIADLTGHGQQFVLCAGGRGGKGNMHFTTSTRQAPQFAQDGEIGEEGQYRFELRLPAEIGTPVCLL